jgi:hypothetical protein
MFNNELTRKFPCWDCVKYEHPNDKGCKILEALLEAMPVMKEPAKEAICDMTFKCSELKYREVEEKFIQRLRQTGLFRAALIYQEERFRLLFRPEAYDKEGNLVPIITDIFKEFNWLGRVRQVTIIDHTDSERDFRKEEEREEEPGMIITKVIHDQSYRSCF